MSEECNRDICQIRPKEFLTAYEKQECLWNPALESYNNKNSRDEAYKLLIKDFNSTLITITDIKAKVKSIRTSYTKELRLQIKRKAEGKTYIPKLIWFNQANSFLNNVSLSRVKRNSSSLEKLKAAHEEKQLHNSTTPDPIAATTSIIQFSLPGRVATINNGINDIDTSSSETKDQQHRQHSPSQQQLNQNEAIYYIQQQHTQHQLEEQQHNTSILTQTDYLNYIKSSPSTTAYNIDNDDNTNGFAGGGTVHDESIVNHNIESSHLLNKTDSTSQNEVYNNYCTKNTNASSNIATTAININSSITIEHKRGGIGSTENPTLNNTTAYIDSSGLDEYDHFCRSAAAQLRCITDRYSRSLAKFKIQEILYKAETGHYRKNPENTIIE